MEEIDWSDSKWLNVLVGFRAFTFTLSFLKVQPYDTTFYKQTIACAEIPLYFKRPFQNDDILHLSDFQPIVSFIDDYCRKSCWTYLKLGVKLVLQIQSQSS